MNDFTLSRVMVKFLLEMKPPLLLNLICSTEMSNSVIDLFNLKTNNSVIGWVT